MAWQFSLDRQRAGVIVIEAQSSLERLRQRLEEHLKRIAPSAHLRLGIFISDDHGHVEMARQLGVIPLPLDETGRKKKADGALGCADAGAELPHMLHFAPCHKDPRLARGRFKSQAEQSKTKDARIEALVAQVSGTRLKETLEALEAFETRWSHADDIGRITDWAAPVACPMKRYQFLS